MCPSQSNDFFVAKVIDVYFGGLSANENLPGHPRAFSVVLIMILFSYSFPVNTSYPMLP
jgi:hypothetical protein